MLEDPSRACWMTIQSDGSILNTSYKPLLEKALVIG